MISCLDGSAAVFGLAEQTITTATPSLATSGRLACPTGSAAQQRAQRRRPTPSSRTSPGSDGRGLPDLLVRRLHVVAATCAVLLIVAACSTAFLCCSVGAPPG